MTRSTTNNKANNKANDATDNNRNMALVDEARTELGNAWSGEASAAINIASAMKTYAASLDENGLGLVAIVNADRKVPYATFKGKYGDDIFDEDDWKAARKELTTLKKLYLEYYSKGKQTFEAWLQNFRRNMMLVQGSKQPTKGSDTMKRRKDNRPLFNKVQKRYKDSQPAKTVQSDTVKIKNKAKSIGVRLNQAVELLEGIKKLESDAGIAKVDKIIASIATLRTRVEVMEGK